jgi:Kef-type K+ transport system membrane component KefB
LVTGFALGWRIPASYLAKPNDRLIFFLFIAVAMSISAVPVIAKILIDLDLHRYSKLLWCVDFSLLKEEIDYEAQGSRNIS